MVTCFIALGSNLGNRQENIHSALRYLKKDPAIKIIKISSLKETEPEDCPAQQKFLNGVVKLQTDYSAQQLLNRLQQIEMKLGRKIPHARNQPRTIDLDILIYGDLQISEKKLQIPHPRMWKREFVTVPLREIAPEVFKEKV